VVSQLNGEHEAKDDTMAACLRRVWESNKLLKHFLIIHIVHSKNQWADALSKLASSSKDGKPKNIQGRP